MLHIGVVGSRRSNELQKTVLFDNLNKLLKHFESFVIVSGGCYAGGDKWAEEYAEREGLETVIFKPKTYTPIDFHNRNIQIAEKSDVLIATIPENPDIRRFAGTEQTVREMMKREKIVILITPTGEEIKYG